MLYGYLDSIKSRFRQQKLLGDKTFGQLEEKDILWQYNEQSNSIAIIVQHLWGNMLSRWTNFLTEDGEKQWRNRDAEFDISIQTKSEMIHKWNEGWDCLLNVLDALDQEDLARTVCIRKEPLSVVDAINRQLAHYSQHVGQIIFIAKMILGDKWNSLSIPKGDSAQFNEKMMGNSTAANEQL